MLTWHREAFSVFPVGQAHDVDVTEFDFRDNGGVCYDENGVKVIHWQRSHAKVGASAYRLEWNGLRVVWTGDGRPSKLDARVRRFRALDLHPRCRRRRRRAPRVDPASSPLGLPDQGVRAQRPRSGPPIPAPGSRATRRGSPVRRVGRPAPQHRTRHHRRPIRRRPCPAQNTRTIHSNLGYVRNDRYRALVMAALPPAYRQELSPQARQLPRPLPRSSRTGSGRSTTARSG